MTELLPAFISSRVARIFPISGSVNRCVLLIDGAAGQDYPFDKQSLPGDTVTLREEWLAVGTPHAIGTPRVGRHVGI